MKHKLSQRILTLSAPVFASVAMFWPAVINAQIRFQFESRISPTSIEGLLITILQALIVLAVPIVVLFIIYSGFLYVTAKGNSEQVQKATTSLTYAVIGGVMIIGAVAISEVIKNVVEAFKA